MFAAAAKEQRARLGLTQAEAAKMLGMSARKLFSIEMGEVVPQAYEQAGILQMYAAGLAVSRLRDGRRAKGRKTR